MSDRAQHFADLLKNEASRLRALADQLDPLAFSQPEAGAGVTEEQLQDDIARNITRGMRVNVDFTRNAARAILARIAQAGQSEAGWRPIDSAPKDGTRLLLWDAKRELAVSGCWHHDAGKDDPYAYEPAWSWWVSDNDIVMWDSGPDDHPTHWQLLPSPPNHPEVDRG